MSAFPQAGIVMSLSDDEAVVAVPIYNLETELCPISKDIKDLKIGDEVLVVFLAGDLHRPVVMCRL